VADPTTTGLFWVSTADNNLITPGESGASWVNLFAGLATETYAAQFNPGRYLNTTVITSSQTYTVPAGVYKIRVRLQAAGGAAGGSADNTGGNGSSCASSGGAGAYVEAIFPVTPGQQIPISIGVGGVGVTGKAGGTGGATTFGPFGSFAALSCPGGLGGYAGTQTSSSAASSIPGCP
ncbi:glycine-rich domain-containing protein, partial [Asaia sp. HN128]|uniref:glycine-rich domain-containing protein n=1 Tax=Asaia sp. HN128 TaxID=3081234 RepID=UPI00301A2B15